VDLVTGRDRHQLAARDPSGQLGELVLRDVAGRAAGDYQRRRGDPGQPFPPRRVGVVALGEEAAHHGPVERRRPLRLRRELAVRRHRRRRVLQDQPRHPVGMLLGEQVGDHAAERVAEDRRPLDAERVEQPEDVVPHQGERVLARPVAGAVTA